MTERTMWLIEHHMDLLATREKSLPARLKRELASSDYFDDLKLLRELDDAGRSWPAGRFDRRGAGGI